MLKCDFAELVEATRGPVVESIHIGAAAVVDLSWSGRSARPGAIEVTANQVSPAANSTMAAAMAMMIARMATWPLSTPEP